MESNIDLNELEHFYEWLTDDMPLSWDEFQENLQYYVDNHFDSYLSWIESVGEE